MAELDLFYKGSKKFYLGHPKIHTHIVVGQRGRGKTTFKLQETIARSLDNALLGYPKPNKFIFLRRSDEQLALALQKGLLSAIKTIPEYRDKLMGFEYERVWRDEFIIGNGKVELPIGYVSDLNNVKGLAVEDADNLIFDEFIEAQRCKYKGGAGGMGEPELLARLDETVFRRRENWITLLGNFDSPTNPYNEYFKIPYGVQRWSNKARGILYEVDYSDDTKVDKEQTTTGKRWAGTAYSDYSNGNVALGSIDEDLLVDKPAHAQLMYNVKIGKDIITIWQDPNNFMTYVHDNYKMDQNKPIYIVMSQDMVVNGLFVNYNSDFLRLMRLRYGRGCVRFNSQKTATLFNLMISLNK